ncbi:MAG: DUF3343 domain-containing protein [Desulfuromusa sp.]|nr:DUF3343 domain-containing protein [Desulfuromusa sp.]
MVNDGDCVAIFHSVHRVMKAEKVLKDRQLNILLIPAPRQLSADCGMAIRYPCELHSEVKQVLVEFALPLIDVWQMQSGKYQLLA